MALDGHVRNIIVNDVGAGTTPENSRLQYTAEMRSWRKVVEKEWEAAKKAIGPGAYLSVPNELPDDLGPIQMPLGWDVRGDGTLIVGKNAGRDGQPLDTEVEAAIDRRAKKPKGD